jgi:hypothetical protein
MRARQWESSIEGPFSDLLQENHRPPIFSMDLNSHSSDGVSSFVETTLLRRGREDCSNAVIFRGAVPGGLVLILHEGGLQF